MDPTRETHVDRKDRVAAALLAAVALVTFVVYLLIYSPAIGRAIESGIFGEAGSQIHWLRLHIVLYEAAYLLLVAAFCMAIVYRRARVASQFPWVEAAVATAGALAVLGINAGERFARPVWGFIPTWSDPKLSVAMLSAWILLLVGLPVAIWARLRLGPTRRYTVLTIVIFVALALGGASLFLGRFARSVHPYPISPWWP